MHPLARVLAAAACFACLADCASAAIVSEPGVFAANRREVAIGGRTIHVEYVKPVEPRHPECFMVFATGDDGWSGFSKEIFEHLARQGYSMAGYGAPEAIESAEQSEERVTTAAAADRLATVFAQAKRDLGLADTTPMIVVGYSRGATMVAFSAISPRLREGVAGAVAIALTREADYLRAPDPAQRLPEIEVDDKGRIQIYPALNLIGATRLAVIQSTHDKYVPAAESRRLLGPDTPTRRLYEIEARNHGFGGAQAEVMRALDDALRWIAEAPTAAAPGK